MKQENALHKISLFDLGDDTSSMLDSWKMLKQKEMQVSFKEYPDIDCYTQVGSKDVIELAIEICQDIEQHKKEIAKIKQAQGIQLARQKGIQLGRKPLQVPKNFLSVYKRIAKKEISLMQATKMLHVDYRTLKKWIREIEEKQHLFCK